MTAPAGYNPGRDPDAPHASRAAPMADSICWRPTDGEATGPGAQQYPIYVRQRALAALHDHFRGSTTQGILGFLVGALLEDPSTRERWLELEFIVRLTQPIYGDKTTLVISRVWERLQQEVGRTGGHMLGWYHSHPPLGTEIAPGDIEAHEQYFGRPWQIALVLGQIPKGPTGAFYRPSAGIPLGTTPLPFFEIVARDSITAEGRKRTRVTWKNYRPDLRRTSGVMTGASAVLQALQAAPRPPDPVATTPSAPAPPRPVAAPTPTPAPPAFAAAATAVAPPATRAEGRTNTPPRGSGAIRVAATTAPRTAEPPLPPAARVSVGIEKAPEPVAFARPAAEATPTPAPAAPAPPPLETAGPVAAPGEPAVAAAGSATGPAPEGPPAPEPARPRSRNPAISGLPIIEPPVPPRVSVHPAPAAPAPVAAASPPAPVAAAAPSPPSPPTPAAPPPTSPVAPAPAPPERLRPSVHAASGLDVLRALPATQTPADRPAVSAAPLSRPSRDRPTSEVLQELADAITRAARASGSMPAVGAPGKARATAPRKVVPAEAGASTGARTPVGGSPAVRPGGPPPGSRDSGLVTFTPVQEPPTRRPGPLEQRVARESAEVTFTPAPPPPAASPLEPSFAPKPPRAESEPEVLPDALRGERPSPPSGLAGATGAASPAAAAPRVSRVAPRRTFGSGLAAEPEPAGSLVRLPYVLALLAALGAAVWWFAIRPRTAGVPASAVPVATAPVDPGPPPAAITPAESVAVEPPAVTTPADSTPSAPPAVVTDVLTPLDLLVDSLDAAIFQYLDRASVFDDGERDCQTLAAALVGVDRLWVAYNAQRRRLDAPLDSLRTLRDQSAYANVEAVDTHFGRSGCPRP